jgi:enamine deaminase RidA (YjgF/YER057c/UK114 family)
VLVEGRLRSLGLYLPEPAKVPVGITIPFAWVRLHGGHAYVSGHGPQAPDGAIAGPFGRVGDEVTLDQAAEGPRLATLSVLASLRRALGDLDRIAAWLRVEGYVLAAPGFDRTTTVINACSDLLLDLFGPEKGVHARTAMGVAATPLNCSVVIAAEVAL